MKNMKVSAKLILSFSIIALLTIIVGALGVYALKTMDSTYTYAIESHGKPLAVMGTALSTLQNTASDMRDAIIYAGDQKTLSDIESSANADLTTFETDIASYTATVSNPDAVALLQKSMKTYNETYKPMLLLIISEAKDGNISEETMQTQLSSVRGMIDEMVGEFTQTMDLKQQMLSTISADNTKLSTTMLIVIIVIGLISAALAIILGLYLSRLISWPLTSVTMFMKKASSTGDLSLEPRDVETISKLAQAKDEVGQCIDACAGFVGRVTEISKSLEVIAGGDLTMDVKMLSDMDTMGGSLKTMLNNLNEMFGEISAATAQVSSGSKQIADGAQALAQGSTQQASSIEELAASLSEISSKTNQNASMSKEAEALSDEIKKSAEKGNSQMDNMMLAVNEINDASNSISKVIKVIDDIAFQTNILALNAAVEAARAGQHGKGFAVVAEEVRNLAAKSAEAAKDTSGLIENSIEKANLGLAIATETSASLKEIVEGINRNAEIIGKIGKSSDEQANELMQINIGVDQVTQVVQQNSATAEESAAASEEMSGQSEMLRQLIEQFKIKNAVSKTHNYKPAAPVKKYEKREDFNAMPEPAYDGGFGAADKY